MKSNQARLVVRKSLRGITIQVINHQGNVLSGTWAKKKDFELATKKVVEQVLKQKIKRIVFDRGKQKYHGLVKKVADVARKAGLEF